MPRVTVHYDPHLVDGFCICNCEDCHSRLTGHCWCDKCFCDDSLDTRHFVETE